MTDNYCSINFVNIEATDNPFTKFGGQPKWVTDPQWPLSKSLQKPMQFIGQIALEETMFPGAKGKVAYLFMTDDDVDTYSPDSGENAVIIQPSAEAPLVSCINEATGPTIDGEYGVELGAPEPDNVDESAFGNKIAGIPAWLQDDETPERGDWQFLLQLDSGEVPFYVNFGDSGVGYAFINEAGTQGKFLWQCF